MWPFARPTVPFEQAVYGSFPFWHRGYDLLGHSPGCEGGCIALLKETCQRLGERLRDSAPPGGLVSRWLPDGSWLVVRPFSPGSDDVGRPDAVAFHALVLDREAARRVDYDPFRLVPAFREGWGPDSVDLPPGSITIPRRARLEGPEDGRAGVIAEAIGRGRRVLVESSGPIDGLARQVWARLHRRARHRRSLATWAYTDSGVFDLVGLPRLTGVDPTDRRLLVVPDDPAGAPAGVP